MKWQIEWDRTTEGVTAKLYFLKVADRLKLKINVTLEPHNDGDRPLAILSHTCTNIKLQTVQCALAKTGKQTTDHILYDCELVKQERDKLKAEILQSEKLARKQRYSY